MKWTIPAVALTCALAQSAGAALTWATCEGDSFSGPRTEIDSRECTKAAFTANGDDFRIYCAADVCTVAIDGSGSVSVMKCVGVTTDGSNCYEEKLLNSSDRAHSIRRGEWWFDVTGSGTVEIGG